MSDNQRGESVTSGGCPNCGAPMEVPGFCPLAGIKMCEYAAKVVRERDKAKQRIEVLEWQVHDLKAALSAESDEIAEQHVRWRSMLQDVEQERDQNAEDYVALLVSFNNLRIRYNELESDFKRFRDDTSTNSLFDRIKQAERERDAAVQTMHSESLRGHDGLLQRALDAERERDEARAERDGLWDDLQNAGANEHRYEAALREIEEIAASNMDGEEVAARVLAKAREALEHPAQHETRTCDRCGEPIERGHGWAMRTNPDCTVTWMHMPACQPGNQTAGASDD